MQDKQDVDAIRPDGKPGRRDGKDGKAAGLRPPAHEENESAIDAFAEEGAGVAAKE